MFFIKQLSTGNDKVYFGISLLLVFIYGFFITFLIEKHFNSKKLAFFVAIYTFLSMFVVMTYNFWVIFVLIFGKIFGFTFFAH